MKLYSKKNIAILGLLLSASLIFAGGKKDKTETVEITEEEVQEVVVEEEPEEEKIEEKKIDYDLRVGILNGPTAIPAAHLLDSPEQIEGCTTSFETFASPVALLPKMLKGEIDIGFMPPNVAAKAFNASNGSILVLGVSGNGNITVITRDSSISSLADLKGKTVHVAGQGATPEYVFRYLLAQNSIAEGEGEDSVTLDFSVPAANIAQELLSGKISYAVVPEPFSTVASMRDRSIVRVLDLQREFEKATGAAEGTSFPFTVVVVAKKYAEKNPAKVSAFAKALENSIAWTNTNPQKAGVLVQKHTLGLMAPIVGNAIPNCAFVFEDATTARAKLESLMQIFLDFAPDSIGAKLPSDEFYFSAN